MTNVSARLEALALKDRAPEDREAAMLDFVRSTIQRVFRLNVPAEELSARDRLSDLGMDSLIALELRGELAKGLGLTSGVSSTIAFDSGTVGELSHALLFSLESNATNGASVQPAAPAASPAPSMRRARQKSRTEPLTAEELNNMSEEEVEQLLSERLSRR